MGFPQVIGATDGCHVPMAIICLKDDLEDYYNIKGFYSFILQGFVDSHLCFWNINVSWPGCAHDAHVYWKAQSGSLVPHPTRRISGADIPPITLGDPIYPLKPWLMTPCMNAGNLSRKHLRFNNKQSKTRTVVENSFGRLKGQWRCILKRLDDETVWVPVIIIIVGACICCVLHNISREEFNKDWLDSQNREIVELPPARMAEERWAVAVRNALWNSFWSDWVNIRALVIQLWQWYFFPCTMLYKFLFNFHFIISIFLPVSGKTKILKYRYKHGAVTGFLIYFRPPWTKNMLIILLVVLHRMAHEI